MSATKIYFDSQEKAAVKALAQARNCSVSLMVRELVRKTSPGLRGTTVAEEASCSKYAEASSMDQALRIFLPLVRKARQGDDDAACELDSVQVVLLDLFTAIHNDPSEALVVLERYAESGTYTFQAGRE